MLIWLFKLNKSILNFILKFFFYLLENQTLVDEQNQDNSIRTSGVGLQQAQVGVKTSFTIDARGAVNQNEDIKVVVTSKL